MVAGATGAAIKSREIIPEFQENPAVLHAHPSALEREVIEKAKALVARAHESSAPRTPVFQAFIDAVDALTDVPPAAGQDGWPYG